MTTEYVEHMRLENRLEMLHAQNVSDELRANRDKESKCAILRRSVPQTPFGFEK